MSIVTVQKTRRYGIEVSRIISHDGRTYWRIAPFYNGPGLKHKTKNYIAIAIVVLAFIASLALIPEL